MPIVITLLHQKGGVGKSTLATNLRSYFAAGGYKAGMVDIDPQGSLSKLVRVLDGGEPENLIGRADFTGYDDLRDKLAPFDIVVIDTPPYLARELTDVLAFTNLVLVPCKASPFDMLAIGDTINLIKEEQGRNPALVVGVVMTMTIKGTDFTAQIREQLEGFGFPVLKTEIANRVAYMRSLLKVDAILSDDNAKAREEIESLGGEIISLLTANHE